ncbi:MAG: histidine phosphatase family protein [Oscillospiraceae bacterium]|nr:histidine phosphatase family protein [Oscillospiraceae bacterium]
MIYIMRHSKTDWNSRHKLQGRTDIPLNDEGREIAKKAAEEYADIHFDVCYCSPLSRARETAQIILNGRDIPVFTDERLVEMSFGEYEGKENSFDDPDCPINVLFWHPEEYKIPPGGAESLEDLFRRTGSFIDEIIRPLEKQGKDVLIVGHGAMNSSIICQMKDMPVKEFWSGGLEKCRLIRLA